VLDSFDVVDAQEYPDLDKGQYDGVIISGSVASVYEDLPWIRKLLTWVADVFDTRPEVRFLGFCFGHQVIAQALGGVVAPNVNGWELGVTSVCLSDVGKSVLGKFDNDILAVQEIHRDHVIVSPSSFLVLGHSDLSPVQGLMFLSDQDGLVDGETPPRTSKARVLTFQGHPEFTQENSIDIIEAIEKMGLASKAITARGKRSAGDSDNGLEVGKSVWKFLGVH